MGSEGTLTEVRQPGIGLISCHVCGAEATSDCTCLDMDDRLKTACDSPYVAFKWCRFCDKHYARCTCPAPQFYVRCGGKELSVPAQGLHMLAGDVIPDTERR